MSRDSAPLVNLISDVSLILATCLALSCSRGGERGGTEPSPPSGATAALTPSPTPLPLDPEAVPRPAEGDAASPTLVFVDGLPQKMDPEAAVREGFTIISLRDDWTPYIFSEFTDAAGDILPNRYRQIYIGLANELTDGDGRALDATDRNYLEVFGIPPALSLVRRRLLEDEEKACHKAIDYALLATVDRVPLPTPAEAKSKAGQIAGLRRRLEKARIAGHHETIAALVTADNTLADEAAAVETFDQRDLALKHAIARLKCDGHLGESTRFRVDPNDGHFRDALQSFGMRHMVYEYPGLRTGTMKAMALPPLESNHAQFVRALRERVVDAVHILEDGTATMDGEPATWVNAAGERVPVENLVEKFTQAAIEQLGVETPEKLLAFLRQHPAEDFKFLNVALRLPPLPEYYSEHMELDLIVDRGDVWYEPAWKDDGVLYTQGRDRMPRLHLYVRHGEQRFPLVKWPTTIGGWRAEQAPNGSEYYRYKNSDVGRRILRQIIAGPTWVAPPSTPIRGLVKNANVHGSRERIVNYDEMGPGYLSAYGLVAGYFFMPGGEGRPDGDNGIRAHGSSDYLSITNSSKFSHGCHRLWNWAAVRLYDFILQHRHKKIIGNRPLNAVRQFYKDEYVYELRLQTRGFQFELTPPLQIDVLEGRIRGRVRSPIDGYVRKPDVIYPPGPDPSPKGGTEP